MNHWYPDLIVAERRLADLRAQADRERLAAGAGRSPLSLRIHLDLQLTLGRVASRPEPQPR